MRTPPQYPAPLRIAVAQMHCVPGDVEANLGDHRMPGAPSPRRDGAALVVLPEMATTGYFIADRLSELAEPDDGPTAQRLAPIAQDAGSTWPSAWRSPRTATFYDAQLLFGPDGSGLRPTARRICSRSSANGSRPATRQRWSTPPSAASA